MIKDRSDLFKLSGIRVSCMCVLMPSGQMFGYQIRCLKKSFRFKAVNLLQSKLLETYQSMYPSEEATGIINRIRACAKYLGATDVAITIN